MPAIIVVIVVGSSTVRASSSTNQVCTTINKLNVTNGLTVHENMEAFERYVHISEELHLENAYDCCQESNYIADNIADSQARPFFI